jgi:hypothetical protein
VVVLATIALSASTPTPQLSTDYTCAADLGPGVGNPKRRFCDVVITTTPSKSVIVPIPPHRGTATLLLDLHNRFAASATATDPAIAYLRHTAIVAFVIPTGEVITRLGVRREFRSIQDLFDRIANPDGGVKFVAPGQPQAVRVVVPAGIGEVGIVGERLEVFSRGGAQVFDSPDRPIALVSNVRVEYRKEN